MKANKMRRRFSLCCVAAATLLLVGCNPESGAATYEVIYPSGYTRDYTTYHKEIPVEGASCSLQWEKAKDYEKTYEYDLRILDENDSVLYEYPNMGSDIMRGLMQEENMVWICAEHWTSHHHRGYLEGWLKESDVFLINLRDGKILFQGRAGENEFYLTSNGTRCYFYAPGKEEQEKLFGLVKIPAEHAEIYYRDTLDWGKEHTVYTFDYVAKPDIDTSGGVETRIKFYISETQLKVVWTSYESVGNGNWEYLEKKAYEIPNVENIP